MKKERGITLIALVITIIVLLILAGVSIAMLTGNNGILTQAQNASKQTEIGEEKEQIALAYNGAVLKKAEEGGGTVTAEDLKEELQANGVTNVTVEDGENGSITVTFGESNRTYTVDADGKISEPTTGTTPTPPTTAVTDGSWSDEKGVNTPVIKENMELVKWDGSKFVTDDTNSSYNYDGEKNNWANAKVTIDGVESYFVWIPRYEYKITYYTDENKTTTSETPTTNGTIDVKFIPTTKTTADDGYIIHPAFRDGTSTNFANGEWDEELPGIWVGKYESSLVNKENSSNIVTDDGTTGNILLSDTKHNGKAIAVQPGMSSWRYCTIGNMYTNAKAYSTDLNSHMLKNSEWGAVAYLTESKYGRNGTEVTINNSSEYITGSAQTTSGTTNDYKSAEGVLASSTGNVTGIYDLSGGAYEYVPAYYKESDYLSNGNSFANGTSDEFSTAYTGTSASSAYKPGDATYETSRWHGDYASFVNSSFPFFLRGGYCIGGSGAGVFRFSGSNGDAYDNSSFRMCLAVK